MSQLAKILLKTFSVLLLIVLIVGSAFLLIYPNLNEIQNLKVQFTELSDFKANTRTFSTTLLSQLAPIQSTAITAELETAGTMEHLTAAELTKLRNSGAVKFNMRSLNTQLKIDKARIDGPVVDGENAFAMDDGFWHFPLSKAPGQRGNTVIIGHRFAKFPPETDTLYNLHLVHKGDKIKITQGEDQFTYTVVETKVVDKTERSVMYQTSDYRLTLITCTPLFKSSHRLVVVAKLDKVYGNI